VCVRARCGVAGALVEPGFVNQCATVCVKSTTFYATPESTFEHYARAVVARCSGDRTDNFRDEYSLECDGVVEI
jgi:hypothetical protein